MFSGDLESRAPRLNAWKDWSLKSNNKLVSGTPHIHNMVHNVRIIIWSFLEQA